MLMSQINMTSIGLLVLFLALTTIHAQNVCSSNSVCINIRNCPDILSALTSTTPISAEVLRIIRNLQCGFESNNPKYCCNQVTTTTTTVKPKSRTPDPRDVTNHPNLRLLNHQACGPVPQQMVIGDNKTNFRIFQYPWMALITYEMNLPRTTAKLRCGGTVISSRYVLTAASCVTGFSKGIKVIGVRVGHDLSKESDCIVDKEWSEIVCTQNFGVDNIHPHPEYENQNDIALIRLNVSIDFKSRNLKPICLPFGTAATLNHKTVIATSWAPGFAYSSLSQAIWQVRLSVVTNGQCKKLYKHICASCQENSSCFVDKGGPLQAPGIYNGKSVRIIQHGVLSHDLIVRADQSRTPGSYTKVSYYMEWILDTMTD